MLNNLRPTTSHWGPAFDLKHIGHNLAYTTKSKSKLHRKKRFAIVHIHGGPDSVEAGEKRFGHVFLNLVKKGHVYIGWNYPGSLGCGPLWNKKPHHRWKSVILKDWHRLAKKIESSYDIPESRIILVGPSFGATLALLVAEARHSICQLVLTSPALCIQNQFERAKIDPKQLKWFKQRFSKKDLTDLSFAKKLAHINPPVSVMYSGRDKVLCPQFSKAVLANAKNKKNLRVFCQTHAGHAPKSKAAIAKRERFVARVIHQAI